VELMSKGRSKEVVLHWCIYGVYYTGVYMECITLVYIWSVLHWCIYGVYCTGVYMECNEVVLGTWGGVVVKALRY